MYFQLPGPDLEAMNGQIRRKNVYFQLPGPDLEAGNGQTEKNPIPGASRKPSISFIDLSAGGHFPAPAPPGRLRGHISSFQARI